MSRTYRRKNEKFYNTLTDYTEDTWWLRWRGLGYITLAERIREYERDKAQFHTDNYEGNRYSSILKWESNYKRRQDKRRELHKVLRDEDYDPILNKKYGNIWNWD